MTLTSRLHQDLRVRGIAVWAEAGGTVGYLAPPDALTAEMYQAMVLGKPALLAHLEVEVRWREEAMRRQADGRTVWPFLVARNGPTGPGACLSCGEPLAAVEQTRCSLCVEAVRRVLGVPSRPPNEADTGLLPCGHRLGPGEHRLAHDVRDAVVKGDDLALERLRREGGAP